MTDEEFEEHVRAALDSLPDDIAEGLENVAVVVEEESPESPAILGSFIGYPAWVRDALGRAAGEGRHLPQTAPGRVSRPRRAPTPDPDHGPPRGRALLRDQRGPDRRARVRLVDFALNAIAVIAGLVGVVVLVLFFLGGRD